MRRNVATCVDEDVVRHRRGDGLSAGKLLAAAGLLCIASVFPFSVQQAQGKMGQAPLRSPAEMERVREAIRSARPGALAVLRFNDTAVLQWVDTKGKLGSSAFFYGSDMTRLQTAALRAGHPVGRYQSGLFDKSPKEQTGALKSALEKIQERERARENDPRALGPRGASGRSGRGPTGLDANKDLALGSGTQRNRHRLAAP